MMRIVLVVTLVLAAVGNGWAAETVDSVKIDGKTYDNVRFGPANQGKVVIHHNRGTAIVPLKSVPTKYLTLIAGPEAQRELEVRQAQANAPDADAPVPNPFGKPEGGGGPKIEQASIREYNRTKERLAVADGKLVDISRVTQLTGFLIQAGVDLTTSKGSSQGCVLEIARKRPGAADVPDEMELRPALWQGTGESVWVTSYSPGGEVGTIVRITAAEIERIDGRRAYTLAHEPTYEEWVRLRGK